MSPMGIKLKKEQQAEAKSPDEAKRQAKMVNAVSLVLFFSIMALVSVAVILLDSYTNIADGWLATIVVLTLLVATYLMFALKIADQWEKAVVLRFGRFTGLKGPDCVRSSARWNWPIS
jgi:cation transport ATPase